DSINPRKSCLRNVDRFRPGLLDLPAPAPVDLRRLLPSGQIR
ncbi:IS3 family transposase, partial [Mycobacterium tuberculosis]